MSLTTTRAVWQKEFCLRRLVWPVVGILILMSAFLWLDFRLVRSQTNVEHQAATFSFGHNGDRSLRPQDLDLYVSGPERLADPLLQALSKQLNGNPYVQNVQPRSGALEPAPGSVLSVNVIETEILWLPVYSRTRMEISFAYASDGAVDWMDDAVVRSTDGPFTVRVDGHLQLQDHSYGLLSWPGYNTYLSETIAAKINGALQSALSNATEGNEL